MPSSVCPMGAALGAVADRGYETRPHRSDCAKPHNHSATCEHQNLTAYRCFTCRALVHIEGDPDACEHGDAYRELLPDPRDRTEISLDELLERGVLGDV